MVETRNQRKVREEKGRQLNSDNMGDPVPTTSAVVSPSRTRSHGSESCRSSRSSATIRAQKLVLQAAHLRKVASAEAAAAAAAVVAASERQAADLELEAQIAALEAESGRSSSSRRSHSSIQNWLASVDINTNSIPYRDVTLEPTADPNACNKRQDGECSRNLVNCGGGSLSKPLPSPTTANIHFTSSNLQQNRNEETRQPTDISLLAQAITSLATTSRPKFSDSRLPAFDGKPVEWLAFKRVFLDTMAAFSPSENLARIGLGLRGAARDAVSVLLVSARDPMEVMDALELRFGRSEFIILQEISSVKSLPKLYSDSTDLNKFACKVRNCVEVIKLLNQKGYLESPEIFQAIISKLTPLLRSRWTDFALVNVTDQSKTKLELLSLFLAQEVELQLKFGLVTDPSSHYKKFEKLNAIKFSETKQNSTKLPFNIQSPKDNEKAHFVLNPCLLCKHKHSLNKCNEFLTMSVSDRWEFVKTKKVCHKCLKRGSHSYRYCKSSREICNVSNCKARHHKLLHDENFLSTNTTIESDLDSEGGNNNMNSLGHEQISVEKQSSDLVAHTNSNNSLANKPYLKVIPVTLSGPLGTVDTHALLDDGSTATFIDSDLCKYIGVSGPESQVRLDCVSGSKNVNVQYVDFDIKGQFCTKIYRIRRARAISNLELSKQTIRLDDIKQFKHLSDISKYLCYERAEPRLIIGVDNWHLTLAKSVRKGLKSQPVAIDTNLGWVLFGFQSSKTKPIDIVNHIDFLETDFEMSDFNKLDLMIQNYYKLDSLGITKTQCLSKNDLQAVKILEETVQKLPDGKYEVGLPWKDATLDFPESYNLAFSRFMSLERKMSKEPDFAKLYKANIQDMLDKKYAEGPVELHSNTSRSWYLPHFGVTNPNKPGKLRIVHDAAARSGGVSLNSMLLTGPDLLNSILDILFRFREGKVGLSADIREMFPQVKIREADRDSQRFIWRNSPSKPIQIFRMSSMIFGAASSPFSAQFIKNRNALEYQDQFPEAVDAILNNHYMDDCIVSTTSADSAAQLAAGIVAIHKNAGYEMRSWVSNDPKALSQLPNNLLLNPVLASVDIDLGSVAKSVRTLGLVWQPHEDCLGFNFKGFLNKVVSDHFTKRDALSLIMSIYDPLGFLSPVIVTARILFQNVWRKSVDWNHQLTQEDISAWKEWYANCFQSITHIKISRRYSLSEFEVSERQLHIFCDASEAAYASVAYWRLTFPNGTVNVVLIGSKVRVAPLKPVSIPRLELQGALVAARLADTICNAHKYKPCRRVFWCDSMNVIGWLRNDARSFKPFVSNRLGEILELSSVSEWRWVPSDMNVADDATRHNREALHLKSRWFTGPSFLYHIDQWPTEPVIEIPISGKAELKPKHRDTCNAINVESSHSLCPVAASPYRISRWLCLIRATALAHLFARKLVGACRKIVNTKLVSSVLTASDLQVAENHVLWQSQIDSFKPERECLERAEVLPRNSRLVKLSPIIDKYNLLRVSGRISAAAEVSASVKSPIILDGKHPAVRLLVLRFHQRAAHANTETVVNELRSSYWIIHLRSTVRSVASHCLFCRQRRATPYNPPVGQLPPARLAHDERPFSYTGLDYFGPIQVTVGRRREKRYVALYTCLVTRAVHLEVVYSLSTDAAMMSLRRFIARRGYPRQIYSDNGTAFVGLNRELRKLYGEQVTTFTANEMIQWRFIPPAAPFMGGAWERLVRSIKTALRVTLKEKAPRDEVLLTLLYEAEAVVNSRPLTHISPDAHHPEALTPSHFLIGTSSGRNIHSNLDESDLCGRLSWKKAARMADQFWQRWMVEYLPLLNNHSGPGEKLNIAVGDMVLIADGNLPRGAWPRGRIVKLYKGKDGIPRVADVNTTGGQLKRPLKKLVPVT